jgi:hypothetical protein
MVIENTQHCLLMIVELEKLLKLLMLKAIPKIEIVI